MPIPKISIITPTYNQGNYIEQTICSILDQEYENLEYIIIDGGSTDNTIDIIKKYEKHISYWVSKKDKGQSHAINKGLAKATGDIFNWINSDDYLEPGALFEVARCFKENPEALAVGGYCRLFDKNKQTSIISKIGINNTTESNIVNYWMNQPSTFYKTDIIKAFGGVNETLHYCMDLEIWFKFLTQYGISRIQYTNHLLSHFRHHDDSKTESQSEGFTLEFNLLLNHITKELGLPHFLCNEFNQIKNIYYLPNTLWNFRNINKSHYALKLSEKYHHIYFEAKNYKALRWSLMKLLCNGKFKFNRYYLSLLYKSILSK